MSETSRPGTYLVPKRAGCYIGAWFNAFDGEREYLQQWRQQISEVSRAGSRNRAAIKDKETSQTSTAMDRKGEPLEVWGMGGGHRWYPKSLCCWILVFNSLHFPPAPPPPSHTNPPVTWASRVPEAKEVKCRRSLALIRKGLVLTPLVPLSLVFSSNISIHSKILRDYRRQGFVFALGETWALTLSGWLPRL